MRAQSYVFGLRSSVAVTDFELFLFKVETALCSISGACFSGTESLPWLICHWFQHLDCIRFLVFLQLGETVILFFF